MKLILSVRQFLRQAEEDRVKRIFLLSLCDYAGDVEDVDLSKETVRDFLVEEIARLIRRRRQESIAVLLQAVKEYLHWKKVSNWKIPISFRHRNEFFIWHLSFDEDLGDFLGQQAVDELNEAHHSVSHLDEVPGGLIRFSMVDDAVNTH